MPAKILPKGTVHIIEDDEHTLVGLKELLGELNTECFSYDSAESFLDRVHEDPKGCMILDLGLKEKSGLELLRLIRNRGWTIPALIVSGSVTVNDAIEAMQFGAIDVLQKPVQSQKLLSSVEMALAVRPTEHSKTNRTILKNRLAKLSEAEKNVLQLLLEGRLNKSIAYRLDIGLRSVVRHRKNVMDKLEFESLPELVRALTLAGLTDGVPDQKPPSFSPLPQRLRHDLRSKLNAVIINYQLYQLQVQQNQMDKAGITGQRIEKDLHDLIDDPCLVSPVQLARNSHLLPVVLLAMFDEQEESLLSSVMKLNEYLPETCRSIPDAQETLLALHREFPAFAIVNCLEGDSSGLDMIRWLLQSEASETTHIIALVGYPVADDSRLNELVQSRNVRLLSRPVDAMSLTSHMLEHLVSLQGDSNS